MRKTILLVAMPESIHVVRWINQLVDEDWDIHLFPSVGGLKIHSEMKGVTFHSPLFPWGIKTPRTQSSGINSFLSRVVDAIRRRLIERFIPTFKIKQLIKVIRRVNPNLVHSLEIQAAGYLMLDARKQFQGAFPPWLVTNWGSDILLFGRLQQNKAKISDVLENCDYYSCECERDIHLARQFGFKGEAMPVFPNTGGFDLVGLKNERGWIATSSRKVILLKGYQHWAGRALVGLRALERCADFLDGYEICIYSANSDVALAAELFTEAHGIPTRIIPLNTSHSDMLSLHAKARISIGLSISDGISTSLLEAIVMGSFPIQSCTACVNEWIEHGVSGMIVPPEDPDIIEMCIRTALTDDKLVDQAAEMNWQVAEKRLGGSMIKDMAVNMYKNILKNG
jgi:Glycosyl transferase 4-like/Glycosyl transferases group 1